jgi:hypothetical protein
MGCTKIMKMVNTFLVCEDYLTSARQLDTKRLQKQCLEAYQILHILFQFQLLLHSTKSLWKFKTIAPKHYLCGGWLLKKEIERGYKRTELLKKTRHDYLSSSSRFVKIPSLDDDLLYRPTHINDVPYLISNTDVVECRDCDTFVKLNDCCHPHLHFHFLSPPKGLGSQFFTKCGVSKRYPKRVVYSIKRKNVCDTEIVTMGFSQHAAVKMWVGYETSLFNYIVAHITALEERGRTINLKHRPLYDSLPIKSLEEVKPWWVTHHTSVFMSHRASLIRKELSQFPPSRPTEDILRYIDNPLIVDEEVIKWLPHGYVWPNSLKLMTPGKFLTSSFPSDDVCSPPQHYEPRFTTLVQNKLKSK